MSFVRFYEQYVDLEGDTERTEGFVSMRCPFHPDTEASAGFDVRTGVFNCLGGCGSLSPGRFLQRIQGELSLQEAFATVDAFKRSNGLIEKMPTLTRDLLQKPQWAALVKKAQKALSSDLPMVQEYMEARGLQFETLQRAGLGYLTGKDTHWKRDSLVFPYTYADKVVGIRYRDEHGNKGGEKDCHFTLWGVDTLNEDTRVAVIVEGESDRLRVMQELTHQGYDGTVVATPGAQFRREWLRELDGIDFVVLLPQADDASQQLVAKSQELLGGKLHVLDLRFKRRQVGKDCCDWLIYNDGLELKTRLESITGSKRRKFMLGAEFEEAGEEPDWLVTNLLAKGQIVVLGGPQKAGKTWVLLNLVRALLLPGDEFLNISGLEAVMEDGNVLIVEEEGAKGPLVKRAKRVLSGTDWKERTVWAHSLGIKMDEDGWVKRLEDVIERRNIKVILYDPLQRLHTKDEQSSTEMAHFWNALQRLKVRYDGLTQIVLHHFGKNSSISDGWDALRGSSRHGGEVDLGIFIEKLPKMFGKGIRVRFDGRDIEPIETSDGHDIHKLAFDPHTWLYKPIDGTVASRDDTSLALYSEVLERGGKWLLKDAAEFFKKNIITVKAWVEKMDGELALTVPSRGNPVTIYVVEPQEQEEE